MRRVVILPWLGEFGWMIMRHCHYVQWLDAPRKVACCQPGQECLFPSAAECFTDWKNPIPDHSRWEGTAWGDWGAKDRFYSELTPILQASYPEHEIHAPHYGCQWHMADAPGFTFRPRAAHELPAVDVVLGARQRAFDGTRNWKHWPALADTLRDEGLTIGVVGREESTDGSSDEAVHAWDHPDGDTAGSVDLLAHCRLYVGVDSGMTHLASVLSVPTLLLEAYASHHMIGPAERANKSLFRSLGPEHWETPQVAAGRVLATLQEADAWHARPQAACEVTAGPGMTAEIDACLRQWPLDTRLTLTAHGCTEGDLQTLHQYRNRFVVIDARRKHDP